MRKLIKRFALLILLVTVLVSGLVLFDYFVVGSQYNGNYQAALLDKVERLQSIREPKIILVGNSNLAFGMDSARLEEAMGMPVVNLGLHGGLGNPFHEQIAKLGIGQGDLVVVCHNSFADDDTITDAELAWITYDYHNELLPIFRGKDYWGMLAAYPAYLRDSLFQWVTRQGNLDAGSTYARSAFNAWGDVAYKPESSQLDYNAMFELTAVTVPEINDTCIDRVNAFARYCEERGAALVVAGYPIGYGSYSQFTGEDFIAYGQELAERLDCPVISDYTDYFFPYDYFYNTILHLNERGTAARTEQLISDLQNWMRK